MTRHHFLASSLRYAAFAGLATIAAVLGRRSLRADCTRTHPCAACPLAHGCELPRAQETRASRPHSSMPPT
jgi:hypothetical protein